MAPPKRQPKKPAGPYGFIRKTHDGEGLAKIKKRIRDVERTLKKGARSAAAKLESERRLRSLQLQYSERYIDNHERTIAQRYRKIKHFELKKATRKVKRAEKELETAVSEEDKKMLQEKVEQLKIDLMYIEYYPKTIAYISLYVTDEPESAEKNEAIRQEIKNKIKEILNTHGDLMELSKQYRKQLKEKLVAQGKITENISVDDETGAGSDAEDKHEEEEEEAAVAGADENEKDDFFE